MNKYPWIGISTRSGTVVEFTAYQIGTVIQNGSEASYHVGYHSTGWSMENFILKQSLKEYMEKYGKDNAEYLMETEQNWLKEYNWAVYLVLGKERPGEIII